MVLGLTTLDLKDLPSPVRTTLQSLDLTDWTISPQSDRGFSIDRYNFHSNSEEQRKAILHQVKAQLEKGHHCLVLVESQLELEEFQKFMTQE